MNQDTTEIIEKSTIHHGKTSNRIYLMKLAPERVNQLIPKLDKLAEDNGYTKIFAKVQAYVLPGFISNSYEIEAFIPRFYNDKTDCLLVSKFVDTQRKIVPVNELELLQDLLRNGKEIYTEENENEAKYKIKRLGTSDAEPITEIFKQVFKTYPFPVHDPGYIVETMEQHGTQYFGVSDSKKLIGVSTVEIDLANKNAEMTDFAVLSEYRGQNIALSLLHKMEQEMENAGIKTCYTIARLNQPGMNKTFLKSGYKYTGTLVNNTNIGGNIESMNILYKHI
jgi:putative beta-lysine N-acetyltransferase